MGLHREVRLALGVAFTVVSSGARADADLTVTRAESAMQCPDGDALRRLARASLASSSPSPAHAYRVTFERAHGAYQAEIVDDTAGRSRRLEDVATGCAPLGQAAALVLATMWSSEHDDASPAPGAAPPSAPAAASGTPASTAPAPAAPLATAPTPASTVTPVPPAPPAAIPPAPAPVAPARLPAAAEESSVQAPETSSPSRPLREVFGAGAALTAAIVRPFAPAISGDAALEFTRASLAVGVLWIPEQRIDVAPGSIAVQLVAGSARGCAFLGDATRLGFCAKVFAGQLHAAGTGFSSDSQHGRPWFALEPEAFVDRSLFGWIRGRASAGMVVPLHAEAFYVAGAAKAYDTPAVGGLFSLSIEVETR